MLAIALALTASISWGVADFVGGLKSRRLQVLTVLAISQLSGLVVIGAAVAISGKGPPGGGAILLAVASSVAGLTGLFAFYRGLAIGVMAVVAPISATSAVIPVVFGLARGESPALIQFAGMALALAGVVLAAREEVSEDEAEQRPARFAAGAGLAVVAAIGFGSFFVAIDEASDDGALWAIFANRVAGVSMLSVAVLALRPSLRVGGADLRALIAVGVLDMSANALFALATREGLVSVVSVLSSLYPVVVVALAAIFLGERLRPSQLAGVALALAGVGLISAG